MTYLQIMVLVVVVCVSAVQCVSLVVKASVMKRKIGVPDEAKISEMIVGAMIEADNTGAMVRICFSDWGTEIVYTPKEMLEGDDEECSTE